MGVRYDLILVAVGDRVHPPSKAACAMALAPDGAYVSVDQELWNAHPEELHLLKQLVEAGTLKPVIDRSYPLEKMAEAHAYVDKGDKKGNVVITIGADATSPEAASRTYGRPRHASARRTLDPIRMTELA